MNFRSFINENKRYLQVSTDVIDIWYDDLDHQDHAYIPLNKQNVIKKGKYEIIGIDEEDEFITVKFPSGESEMVMSDIETFSHIFKII